MPLAPPPYPTHVHPLHAWQLLQHLPFINGEPHLPHDACCAHVYVLSGATSEHEHVSGNGCTCPLMFTTTRGSERTAPIPAPAMLSSSFPSPPMSAQSQTPP